MSPVSANTRSSRSTSTTPSNTPAKNSSYPPPPASVGKMLSALTLHGASPTEPKDGEGTITIPAVTSSLRVNLFALLGANPTAHDDPNLRTQYSALLEEYTKAECVASSDPIFCIGKHYFGMKEYKLVLVGGASVGKSSYVKKLKSNRFTLNCQPTHGVEVTTIVVNSNSGYPIKLDIWDLAGCEKNIGILRDGYYVGSNAVILMYDITSIPSMEELTERHKRIVRVCADIPTVLVGNKAELSSKQRKKKQKGSKEVVSTFRRRNKLQHFEVSTKSGLNFEKPILYLLKELTGESNLKLIGSKPVNSCKSPLNVRRSSPEVLEGKSKKSATEVKGKSDVSVAAATPLPKIDEEGI